MGWVSGEAGATRAGCGTVSGRSAPKSSLQIERYDGSINHSDQAKNQNDQNR
jgi:hypothetical protein